MNYNEYISEITPSCEMKEQIRKSVKKELSIDKSKKSHSIKTALSLVACFTIVMTTFSVYKSTQDSHNPNKENISTSIFSNEYLAIDEDIGDKTIPQEIIIDNVFYRQFSSFELKGKLEKHNGNTVIKNSDIGNYICKLDEKNIYNVDESSLETKENAKNNKFFGAKVYNYLPCKDLSNIVIKTKTNAYLFHVVNINNGIKIEKLFDIFSIEKQNNIRAIEVWQDKIVKEDIYGFQGETINGNTTKEILVKTISDNNEIVKITDALQMMNPIENENTDDIYFNIHNNSIDESMIDTNQYRLVFELSNGLSFEIQMRENCKYVQILESTFYMTSISTVNEIVNIVK